MVNNQFRDTLSTSWKDFDFSQDLNATFCNFMEYFTNTVKLLSATEIKKRTGANHWINISIKNAVAKKLKKIQSVSKNSNTKK